MSKVIKIHIRAWERITMLYLLITVLYFIQHTGNFMAQYCFVFDTPVTWALSIILYKL